MSLLCKIKITKEQFVQVTDIIVFRNGTEAEVTRIEWDDNLGDPLPLEIYFRTSDGTNDSGWYTPKGDYCSDSETSKQDIVKVIKQTNYF